MIFNFYNLQLKSQQVKSKFIMKIEIITNNRIIILNVKIYSINVTNVKNETNIQYIYKTQNGRKKKKITWHYYTSEIVSSLRNEFRKR